MGRPVSWAVVLKKIAHGIGEALGASLSTPVGPHTNPLLTLLGVEAVLEEGGFRKKEMGKEMDLR